MSCNGGSASAAPAVGDAAVVVPAVVGPAVAALPDAFIVCHGSFNPVTRNHVALMMRARASLEAAGYRVVLGVLAQPPSPQVIP